MVHIRNKWLPYHQCTHDSNGYGYGQSNSCTKQVIIVLPIGWWLIERKKKVGWIPSSYLKKTNADSEADKEDVLGLLEDCEWWEKEEGRRKG